jgi:hypothetical protein
MRSCGVPVEAAARPQPARPYPQRAPRSGASAGRVAAPFSTDPRQCSGHDCGAARRAGEEGRGRSLACRRKNSGRRKVRLRWRAKHAHEKYQRLVDDCKTLPPTPTAVVHPCDQSSLQGAVGRTNQRARAAEDSDYVAVASL